MAKEYSNLSSLHQLCQSIIFLVYTGQHHGAGGGGMAYWVEECNHLVLFCTKKSQTGYARNPLKGLIT